MWIQGKEYYSVSQWVGILNRDYEKMGIKVNARDIHVLFNHFGIKGKHSPYNTKIIVYPKILVNQLRTMTMSDKFMDALYNISEFGNINGVLNNRKQTQSDDDVVYEPTYRNNENDMEAYSNFLINQYQTEGVKKVKISESSYRRIFEDVYMTNADTKKKKVQLKYDKSATKKYNKGNLSSLDMLKTDKMDSNNNDTYEVPLKGGIMSYNITSINGTDVMHYFKRHFDRQKTYTMYNQEEYELEMQDSEFKNFMMQFTNKVNNVVNYQLKNIGGDAEIDGISIYPVPSSSNFNLAMAQRMSFGNLGGFSPSVVNQSILKKDLSSLQKDDEFIEKNSEYYTSRYSSNFPEDITHMDAIDRDYNRFTTLSNAQKNIEKANEYSEALIKKYYTRKEVNSPSFYAKLNELYLKYIESVKQIFNAASYFDAIAKTSRKIQPSKIAKALKYSKGPSIEKRSGEIYSLLKQEGYLKGMPKPNENNPYSQVCRWEPVNFQIKNLGNDVRMALKNYFSINDDDALIKSEVDGKKNNLIIVFDDNISGGATLSDICMQLKNLGFKHILPITFGQMRESWNSGRMVQITQPKKFNY